MSAKNGSVETGPPPASERLEERRRQLAETTTALQAERAAIRSGTGDVDAVVRLEARAGVLCGTIAELEQVAKDETEARCGAEAQRRMTAIVRAFGSLAHELDEDEGRFREAADGCHLAAQRVIERFQALGMLAAEASAVGDRFGLAVPAFPPVVVPVMREGLAAGLMAVQGIGFPDHNHVRATLESDAHRMRTRRTYEEVSGTPAAEIIKAAGGPKPWPELTARQRAIVEERARQQTQEADELRRFAVEADRSRERSAL